MAGQSSGGGLTGPMLRKAIKTLALAIAISTLLSVSAFAETATVSANYVNLRTGPGLNAEVVDCLSRGTVINVTDKSIPGWYAVEYNGRQGFMSSDYISILQGNVIVSAANPVAPAETVPVATPENTQTPTTPAVSVTPVITDVIPTAAPAVEQEPFKSEGAGSIGGDFVRFRTGPGTNYTIIASYNRGQRLEILGVLNDWTKCSINGKTGFVFSQYVIRDGTAAQTPVISPVAQAPADSPAVQAPAKSPAVQSAEAKTGYISGNNVRFRSGPSLSAGIIRELYYSNSLSITGYSGDWTAVVIDGQSGYVFSQYVKEGSCQTSAGNPENSSAGTASGSDIVGYAMQFLGCSYKYGGTDPATGFDCSGLVYYVYDHFGYRLNRVAADQAKNGTAVAGDLQPGDILCFYTNGTIGHSGIYIGDGKFIHAANSGTGVIVTELAGYYTNRGYEARRIIA